MPAGKPLPRCPAAVFERKCWVLPWRLALTPQATIAPVCTFSMTGDKISRSSRVKLLIVCCIFLFMVTLSTRAAEDSVAKLAQDSGCARAIDWIVKNTGWVTDQQIRLTEIPAPEFNETQRGIVFNQLLESSGFNVRTDELGNVIAERPG